MTWTKRRSVSYVRGGGKETVSLSPRVKIEWTCSKLSGTTMGMMKIEAVPYELTEAPQGKDEPSVCEPNPEHRVPLSKVPLRYQEAVDPKW